MENGIAVSKNYVRVKYRCKICRNQFERVIKKEAGFVRLTCSFCGSSIVIFV